MWWRMRRTTRSRSATGQRQSSRSSSRQLRADRLVAQEPAVRHRRRLADVVEQCREADPRRLGRGPIDRAERVIPEVLAGDLVLRHAGLRGEIRGDGEQQPGIGHQPKADRRALGGEQPPHLARDPLAGQVAHVVGLRRGWRPASRARSRSRASPPAGRRGPSGARPHRSARPGRRPSAGCGPRGRPGRRADRRVAAASPGSAPQAIALTVKSRRARSSVDGVGELDPMRPTEVGVVVVGAEGRDLDLADGRVVRARRRPCRTRSRRRRPGRAPSVRSGGAAVARSQSFAGRPRSAVAERPTHDVGRMATGPERARAGRGRRPGSRVRGRVGSPRRPLGASVPPEEQVRPPRVVALVREVRREQRVDVAARLDAALA